MSNVQADCAELYMLVQNMETAIKNLEYAKKSILHNYQQLGESWSDSKYKELGGILQECNSSFRTLEKILLTGEKGILQIIKYLQDYENTNLSGINNLSSRYTLHLSPGEVNSRYQEGISDINEQIENYKYGLMKRGVPEGYWLTNTLAKHKAAMLEQLGYDLDVAGGHGQESVYNSESYCYPTDYTQFYNQLAEEFRDFCLKHNNPNYDCDNINEWFVNCQRCVPTYEMQRRGQDVTAQPCVGDDYIATNPFSVWQDPEIICCSDVGNEEIEATMQEWGDGARAQIVVLWTPFNGHTFIAEQIDGRTQYIDPQSGNADYTEWTDSALPGFTQFCRIDNLQTSSSINECYTEVQR